MLNFVDRVHSEHDTFKSPMKKNPVLLVFSHVLLGFALPPVLAQTPTPAHSDSCSHPCGNAYYPIERSLNSGAPR